MLDRIELCREVSYVAGARRRSLRREAGARRASARGMITASEAREHDIDNLNGITINSIDVVFSRYVI